MAGIFFQTIVWNLQPGNQIRTLLLTERLGRPWLGSAFEGLELCDGKLSRTVLRGLGASNGPRLPGLDGDLINKELFIIGFHFNSVNMEIDGTFST
jgi:hypothetical protein